jgi:hypothetical protein
MGATYEISRPHYRKDYHKPIAEVSSSPVSAAETTEPADETTVTEEIEVETTTEDIVSAEKNGEE